MKLENIGAIKQFTLPDDWTERKSGASMGVRWERFYNPNSAPSVELSVSYRGVPLDEASRKMFKLLLDHGESNDLSDETILALKTVMGVATTGDNRYTNKQTGLDGPVFDLRSVTVQSVAGKMVLRVEGQFTQNKRLYTGMFYPAGSEGKMVEELYLQSVREEDFAKFEPVYKETINSIVWR